MALPRWACQEPIRPYHDQRAPDREQLLAGRTLARRHCKKSRACWRPPSPPRLRNPFKWVINGHVINWHGTLNNIGEKKDRDMASA